MKQLTSYEKFQSLLKKKSHWVLFKHSTNCSISSRAFQELEEALKSLNFKNIYLLDVLTTESLKFEIAAVLEITHESPQVIIFEHGKVKAFANHRDITAGWLINQRET